MQYIFICRAREAGRGGVWQGRVGQQHRRRLPQPLGHVGRVPRGHGRGGAARVGRAGREPGPAAEPSLHEAGSRGEARRRRGVLPDARVPASLTPGRVTSARACTHTDGFGSGGWGGGCGTRTQKLGLSPANLF